MRKTTSASSSTSSSFDGGDEGPPPTKTPAPSPFVYTSYEEQGDNDALPEDDEEEVDGEDDGNLLEIMIETLTGTSFQVRVSPWETTGGLKDLLNRTQGIPSCHQHILLGQRELLDESPLIDQGVQDGSSLKLILSMKGGPINSFRVPTQEDAIWKDFNTYMEMNKDELWEGGNSARQVTLLVLREGDDVNIYRVVENADGSFSPLNESWSSTSLMSERTDSSTDKEIRLQDDTRMHQRIADLRSQMDALHLKKQEKKKKKKVVVGKVYSKSTKMFSPRTRKSGQKSPRYRKQNVGKLFQDLAEEDSVEVGELSRSGQSHAHSDFALSKAGAVPPLSRLPSTNFSSPRSSYQFSHRSDQTSRPQSQILPYPPSPLESARVSLSRKGPSRPITQERRSSLSRAAVLDEIPHSFAPIQVDFSRRKRLDAIRAQREWNNNLGPLTEDNNSINSSSHVVQYESYRKSLVRHTKKTPIKTQTEVGNSNQDEAWQRSAVPTPFYMHPVKPKRKSRNNRLNQSFNSDFLKFQTELGNRPKTSPEILVTKRPGTSSTNSTMSERIQLRGPDEKLKEIISILNSSRTDSRDSIRSLESSYNSLAKKLQNHNEFNTDKTTPGDKISLSGSFNSFRFRGSDPLGTAFPGAGASFPKDQNSREALKELVRAQGIGKRPSTRKSTPDTFRKSTKQTPGSRNSTPGKFPPLTPKKKTKRLQRHHCRQCQRKLGISNTYSCRCGHVFCATHRYSEAHDCTFDYKAEGRKFLEMTNPLVVPPKLPKI